MVANQFPIWRKNSISKVVLGISGACVAGFYYQIQLSNNRNTTAHRLDVSFNISTYHVGTLDWHHCPPCLLLLWSLQAYPRLLLQMTACQATSFARSERTYQATSFCNKTSTTSVELLSTMLIGEFLILSRLWLGVMLFLYLKLINI